MITRPQVYPDPPHGAFILVLAADVKEVLEFLRKKQIISQSSVPQGAITRLAFHNVRPERIERLLGGLICLDR